MAERQILEGYGGSPEEQDTEERPQPDHEYHAHRHRFRGGIQVAAPPAFVRCRARAQRVITRRTPARPESIRAGDAPGRRINPFRRSHIFAVRAA
jgi:hypothetical protein